MYNDVFVNLTTIYFVFYASNLNYPYDNITIYLWDDSGTPPPSGSTFPVYMTIESKAATAKIHFNATNESYDATSGTLKYTIVNGKYNLQFNDMSAINNLDFSDIITVSGNMTEN